MTGPKDETNVDSAIIITRGDENYDSVVIVKKKERRLHDVFLQNMRIMTL